MKYEIESPQIREDKLLVLRRNNLIASAQEKNIEDILLTDIARDLKPLYIASVALFVDENGATRILKNRYGFDGVVVSEEKYKKCQNLT